MDKKELEEIVKHAESAALQNFEKDKEVAPILIIYCETKEGERVQALMPMSEEMLSHRRDVFFILGKEFLKNDQFSHVDALIFVSEAWMSKIDKKKNPEKFERTKDKKFNKEDMPSNDPDKMDVIMITGMSDLREISASAYKVENRDKVTKIKQNWSTMDAELLNEFWRGMGVILGK